MSDDASILMETLSTWSLPKNELEVEYYALLAGVRPRGAPQRDTGRHQRAAANE